MTVLMSEIFSLPLAPYKSTSRLQNFISAFLNECIELSTFEFPLAQLLPIIKEYVADGCALVLLGHDILASEFQLGDQELAHWLYKEKSFLLQNHNEMIAGYCQSRGMAYLALNLGHGTTSKIQNPLLVLWRKDELFDMDDYIMLLVALRIFEKSHGVVFPQTLFAEGPVRITLSEGITVLQTAQAALNSVNDYVFLTDIHGNLKWWNRNAVEIIHALVGGSLQKSEWHWLVQISHPDDASNVLTWATSTVRSSEMSSKTFRFMFTEHTHLSCNCRLSSVKALTINDDYLWVLALSSMASMERELLPPFEGQGSLVNCISSQVQDLRIPLTLSLELLSKIRVEIENSKAQNHLHCLINNLSQMDATLNGILLMNDRISAFIPHRKIPVNIELMVDDIIFQKKNQFKEKDAMILVEIPSIGLPEVVRADDLRLRQILANILTYAYHAIEPENDVQIDVNRDLTSNSTYLYFNFVFLCQDNKTSELDLEVAKKLALVIGGCISVENKDQFNRMTSIKLRVPVEEQIASGEFKEQNRSTFLDALKIFHSSLIGKDNVNVFLCVGRETLRRHIAKLLGAITGLTLTICSLESIEFNPNRKSIIIVESADEGLANWVCDHLDINFSPGHLRFICIREKSLDYTLQDLALTTLPAPFQDIPFLRIFQDAFIRLSITNIEQETAIQVINERREDISKRCPLRIMVADDSILNLHVLVKTLHRMGYHDVLAVQDGQAAFDTFVLETHQRKTIDVIFMDMQMPILDGCGAAAKIRGWIAENIGVMAKDYFRPPHIIALTAKPFQEDQQVCLRSGMCRFSNKPIQWEVLENLLEEAFDAVTKKFTCRCQNLAMSSW